MNRAKHIYDLINLFTRGGGGGGGGGILRTNEWLLVDRFHQFYT